MELGIDYELVVLDRLSDKVEARRLEAFIIAISTGLMNRTAHNPLDATN